MLRPPRPLPITMAHQPPRFPVLVFVFLAGVHVLVSRAAPLPPTYDASMCSESSKCGSVDIHYPFYLASATRATTGGGDYGASFSCGYTDLKIFCEDDGKTETAIILLEQYNYTVKDISYDASTILVADADAFGGGGNDACPVVHHNVSFGTEWLRYEVSSYDNLTFYFGCYKGELLPDGLYAYQINCPGFNNAPGGGASLVFSSEQHEPPQEHNLAEHCGQVISVPVLRDYLYGLGNLSVLPREYGRVLKQGFELAWNRTTAGQCYGCEDSGGRCAYSDNRTFLGCLCSGGKVDTQTPYCSNFGDNSTAPRSS